MLKNNDDDKPVSTLTWQGGEATYCVKICGKCFNGRLEVFYGFQPVLEETRRKREATQVVFQRKQFCYERRRDDFFKGKGLELSRHSWGKRRDELNPKLL